MKQKRCVYTEEFRQEALRLLSSSGKGVREIERELGITPGLLYKWHTRYEEPERKENGSNRASIKELEAEIRRLKRENGILQEEREILKKAVRLFSQEPG
jgi:transposase